MLISLYYEIIMNIVYLCKLESVGCRAPLFESLFSSAFVDMWRVFFWSNDIIMV